MNADAYADAYASADADAFAHAYWFTECVLDAYADLAVTSYGIIQIHAKLISDPDPIYDRYQFLIHEHTCVALARLADGLVESLARVAASPWHRARSQDGPPILCFPHQGVSQPHPGFASQSLQ